LKGYGEDEDGFIVSYLWISDRDGEIGSAEEFSTSSLSIGIHTIEFSVQDDGDDWSQATTQVLTVKATNEKPVVAILLPDDGIRVDGLLTISGFAEDPDGALEEVSISVDGGSWEELEQEEDWTYELNTSFLSIGEHTISIRAFDGEEYSEEEYLTFYVGAEKKDEQDVWMIMAFVTLVIVMVIILAAALGRKKPPSVQVKKEPRTFQALEESETESPQARITW
jgi:hypothetical protein